MDRGRDRRYDDRAPVGETYRPMERGGRSPAPRADNYRAPRSPPRRTRSPGIDSYAPRGGRGDGYGRNSPGRRRSRSPAYRGRDSQPGYRGRVRTPPRPLSPRREMRPRSPVSARRYSRSPRNSSVRARSPKRLREPTPPAVYRQRSPLPAKRERYTEPPREDYDRRAKSPPRETPSRFHRENDRQPRERSRTPPRRSNQISRAQSPISSRRSSPPMHPDRMAISRSPAYVNTRVDRVERVDRSNNYQSPRRNPSPPPRSPPREPSSTWRGHSPLPTRERDGPRNGFTPTTWSHSQMAPSNSNHRNGDTRPQPVGPDPTRRDNYSREQPPAPPAPPSAPVSMSAHNRATNASLLQAPTRPRGGPSFGRDSPRDASYGGPAHHRGGRHHSGPSPRQPSYDSHSVISIPTGPRGANSMNGSNNPPPYDPPPRVPFRSNNSTSTTYPRTQRFHQHLSNLPSIVPGGKPLPSGLDPGQERRLQQLEDDRKKLLEAIEEKQKVKRSGLKDWEKAERESKRDMLKSELAEGHLDRLAGEEGMSGGAY
ncbi:MAG: hypothetical protein MMC33_002584 [Icmadophila ericetorum]|nr:hypothetical protein [Icmadophila ericetorum]